MHGTPCAGITIPESFGGLGESLLTYALVVEEIARGLLREYTFRGEGPALLVPVHVVFAWLHRYWQDGMMGIALVTPQRRLLRHR